MAVCCCSIGSYRFYILCTVVYLLSMGGLQIQAEDTQPRAMDDLNSYLQEYNYLPVSGFESQGKVTPEQRMKAIQDLQYMAGLEESGVVDSQTEAVIRGKRCGVIDFVDELRTTEADELTSWQKGFNSSSVSWNFMHPPEDVSLIRSVAQKLNSAFDFWKQTAPNVDLDFKNVLFMDLPEEHSDLQIEFRKDSHQDGYPFSTAENPVAHAFQGDSLRKAQIHFNDKIYWSFESDGSDVNQVDFMKTAAHEIGHVLGLRHSNLPNTLMNPWTHLQTRSVTDDEKVQLRKLYSKEEAVNTTRESITENQPRSESCPTFVDSVLVTRNRAFFFQNERYWLVSVDGSIEKNRSIHEFWYGLPTNIHRIDAAYENAKNGDIILFTGNRYYNFTNNKFPAGYPEEGRPITELHLPHDIKRLDDAFVWSVNDMTYFISGHIYWKYDEIQESLSPGYPRDMAAWTGVPLPIDAAFTYFDDNLYFVKGDQYWKFDSTRMAIADGYPRHLNDFIACNPSLEPTPRGKSPGSSFANNLRHSKVLHVTLFLLAGLELVKY